MTEEEALVIVEAPAKGKKFLGILPLDRRQYVSVRTGMHLYASTQQSDGSREFRRIMEDDAHNKAVSLDGAYYYHVGTDRYRFSPTFSKVVTDEKGHNWDCKISGQLSISDSRRMLTSFAANISSPSAPVTPSMAESWIANQVAPKVLDAVREYSITDLRDKQALPPLWWQKQLAEWVAEFGVAVQVDEVLWTSAQAEIAEAEAARQRDLERVFQARKREREAELLEAASKIDYEKNKKQIESDLSLSELEQSHQLQLLEKRHRKELIEAEAQIENARREAEKIALEHEVTLARMRQDDESIKQAEERDRQAEVLHQAVVKELDELKSTLSKLANLPENLLAQLANHDAQKANVAAERIVSPEFDVSADALTRLGYQVDRQSLVESLRKQAIADGDKVFVRKADLHTRDVGTAKVKGLPINSSLQFEFTTERGGYVTLLNVGTSGKIYIHVPNCYVTHERAIVYGGRNYRIPGPELMPMQQLEQFGLNYIEVGPPGWEHIAVLVSNEPLFSAQVFERSAPEAPLIELMSEEISDLCNTLMNEPTGTWSAGVLSFLVG